MAATLQYGRERAHLGRSLLNFMRIARDTHAPDLTLGEATAEKRDTAIKVKPTTAAGLQAAGAHTSRAPLQQLSRAFSSLLQSHSAEPTSRVDDARGRQKPKGDQS